ncbi:MAG: hypothetical protein KDK90_23150 [Leptospiraceae bacterium]|nr:hypothetical protein [Leptospiraceae bacterium]
MKTANFKDWNLDSLDKTFELSQILQDECEVFQQWNALSKDMSIDDFEQKNLLKFQKPLQWGGKAWNEFELESKFISPLIMTVEFDDRKIGYFLERHLKGIVRDYELSGIVDGMIATGFRSPNIPFFCMHEYKRSVDNDGNPDAQSLAAMLVARELNKSQKPIYGLYIVGLIWNFMVLDGNEYCIGKSYNAEDEEIFDVFRMLKALKHIIKTKLL